MSELRIVRGTDVGLYAGDTPLFGVISLTVMQKNRYREVYEYLSAKPCERLPQGSVYEITLRMMSLFDDQLPSQDGFTLRIVDGNSAYCYYNCRVTGRKTELNGNHNAAEVFTVEADSMSKRWARV